MIGELAIVGAAGVVVGLGLAAIAAAGRERARARARRRSPDLVVDPRDGTVIEVPPSMRGLDELTRGELARRWRDRYRG